MPGWRSLSCHLSRLISNGRVVIIDHNSKLVGVLERVDILVKYSFSAGAFVHIVECPTASSGSSPSH